MKKISLVCCAFVGLFANSLETKTIINKEYGIGSSLSVGILKGEAKEYVYGDTPNDVASRLDWKIKHAPILKGDIYWDVLPWLTLNLNGWVSIKSGKGKMSDYDWLDDDDSQKLTDQSHHSNTPLNYANEFDLNAKGWIFNDFGLRFGGMLGYKQSKFSWTAKGGSYIYTDEKTKKISMGNFSDGETVIGYKQEFYTPYIGLVFEYKYDNFELSTSARYSKWTKAKDKDEHYKRGITFQEEGKNAKFYSINLNAGYYFTPNLKLFAEYGLNHHKLVVANMHKLDRTEGTSDTINDSAGISNKYQTIMLGLAYKF